MDVFRLNLNSLCSAMRRAGVTKITIKYSGQDKQLSVVGPKVHWPKHCTPLLTDNETALGDIDVVCDVLAFNDEIGECELVRGTRFEPYTEVSESLFNSFLRMSELTDVMFAESTYGVFTINDDKTCNVTYRVPLEDTHVVTYSMTMANPYPKRSIRKLKPAKIGSSTRTRKSTTR